MPGDDHRADIYTVFVRAGALRWRDSLARFSRSSGACRNHSFESIRRERAYPAGQLFTEKMCRLSFYQCFLTDIKRGYRKSGLEATRARAPGVRQSWLLRLASISFSRT